MQAALKFVFLWGVGFLVYTVIDALFLGVVANKFFQNEIGTLMYSGDSMPAGRIAAALATWLVIVLGIVSLVLPRVGQGAPLWKALLWGGLFGAVVYGTYELTNYAVLRDWSLRVVAADIVWGAVLCGVVSLLLAAINR